PRHPVGRELCRRQQDLLRLSRQGRGNHPQARRDQRLSGDEDHGSAENDRPDDRIFVKPSRQARDPVRLEAISQAQWEAPMAPWHPDASFHPSPRQAAKAPAETFAYVAAFDPTRKAPDAIAVVDVDPTSSSYGKIVGTVAVPNTGDEFHHFGWNACSSCLCPHTPHPHGE